VFTVRLSGLKNEWLYLNRIFVFEHFSVSVENITAGDQILNRIVSNISLFL
jgi:hypothetical protein